jgi:isocitrate/isopropylmalate dehydrogenase
VSSHISISFEQSIIWISIYLFFIYLSLLLFFFFRKLSDGLFLETSKKVAKDYPQLEHNAMIIDNCCMQLVSNPHQFDVMIMTNLYGTIVSNVVCGLVGGAGLLSGKNYGDHVSSFLQR